VRTLAKGEVVVGPAPPANPAAGGALPWLDLRDTEAVAAFVLGHAQPL